MWGEGHRLVAGVDEVGRGAWAGPLSVGVAVLREAPGRIPRGLRDSKQLTEEVRESIFDAVAAWCAGWAVGHAGPDECDRLGMTAALRLATRRAFGQLPPELVPDAVVLDGTFDYVSPPAAPTLFGGDGTPGPAVVEPLRTEDGALWAPPVRTVIGADARCASVAAWYPPFEFERNKGYPSPTHKRALCGYGLSAVHRRSWAFVDSLPWELTTWPAPFAGRADGGGRGTAHDHDDPGSPEEADAPD